MVEAAYRKYPNPHTTSVDSLDTLERSSVLGRLYSHRIFCTKWSIPSFVHKILDSNPEMYVSEQSQCCLGNKKLTICARNISLTSMFTLNETLEYTVNSEDPNTTVLRQTAQINVHGVPMLGGVLERLWSSQYESSVAKGRLGVQYIAEKISLERKS